MGIQTFIIQSLLWGNKRLKDKVAIILLPFSLLIALACSAQGPVESSNSPSLSNNESAIPLIQNDNLVPGQSFFIDFPSLATDRRDKLSQVEVYIPTDYDSNKFFPLLCSLGGGDGSNSAGLSKNVVGTEGFICIGLPFAKDLSSSFQNSLVGRFPEMWQYHSFMLQEVLRVVPNIDPQRRFIQGFSNGGHAIDGMLGIQSDGFRDFFQAFILVEGGSIGEIKFSLLKGKRIFYCWGNTSLTILSTYAQLALDAGMIVSVYEMNAGHTYNTPARQVIGAYIKSLLPLNLVKPRSS